SATSTWPPCGESASRSAGRARPGVGRVPTIRSTPRASRASTPWLTVVRASPAACTRSALLTAVPEATNRASVLSVTGPSRRADRAGALRRNGGNGASAFRPSNDTGRHYSVVVRYWSMRQGRPTRRTTRWRHGGARVAADARHRQGVPGCPRARRGRPGRRRGRGALPARPERGGQVDPDQGAGGRVPP